MAKIEAFIDRCEAARLPISSFHFGSGYTSIGPKRYVFNWKRSNFPDAAGLMRRFHAHLAPLFERLPAFCQNIVE